MGQKLSEEISGLQSSLAASHAAYLALQQEHKQSMEQAALEKQQMEQLHDNTVEGLKAVSRRVSPMADLQDTSSFVIDQCAL